MASALFRTVGQATRRSVFSVSARACWAPAPIDPEKGKVADKGRSMPDTLGHTVGPERWELLTRRKGTQDPFEMNIAELKASTIDTPNLIPSVCDSRIVGCICEEDNLYINWMHLYEGEVKRCYCGHWFKLAPVDTANYAD